MNFGEKKSATWKWGGRGGSTAVWNFSKNSSVLVGTGFPYRSLFHFTFSFGACVSNVFCYCYLMQSDAAIWYSLMLTDGASSSLLLILSGCEHDVNSQPASRLFCNPVPNLSVSNSQHSACPFFWDTHINLRSWTSEYIFCISSVSLKSWQRVLCESSKAVHCKTSSRDGIVVLRRGWL